MRLCARYSPTRHSPDTSAPSCAAQIQTAPPASNPTRAQSCSRQLHSVAEFIHYRTALLVYWSNIFLLGFILYWSWSYATRAQLLVDDLPPEVHPAVVRRIVIAQSLYAAGAALCFIDTYYAIAAIVLVQLNYAIAPRFCWGLFSRKRTTNIWARTEARSFRIKRMRETTPDVDNTVEERRFSAAFRS